MSSETRKTYVMAIPSCWNSILADVLLKETKSKEKAQIWKHIWLCFCDDKFQNTSLLLTEAKCVRKQHYESRPPSFCTQTNHSQLERDRRPLMAKWLFLFISPSMMDKITWCHRCHSSHGNMLHSQSTVWNEKTHICRNAHTVTHLKAHGQCGWDEWHWNVALFTNDWIHTPQCETQKIFCQNKLNISDSQLSGEKNVYRSWTQRKNNCKSAEHEMVSKPYKKFYWLQNTQKKQNLIYLWHNLFMQQQIQLLQGHADNCSQKSH